MKLSVLIPVYNYRCYALVADLHEQLERCGVGYEILVADDGSRDRVCIISNLRINELSHCQYILRERNVGRAGNLNWLIANSSGEWKLVVDCDARVTRRDFVDRYLEFTSSGYDVLDGDLVNPPELPSERVTLRYRYEKCAEKWRSAEERNRDPYSRFCTFNVMFRASVLDAVPFDERCREYGYEDTLMGIELGRRGFRLLHIDNPLMHLGFEPNDVYLGKVETSLRTLHGIRDSLHGQTRMTRLYDRLQGRHLLWLVRLAFRLSGPLLRRNLLGRCPDMTLLAFYKLGYYACLN